MCKYWFCFLAFLSPIFLFAQQNAKVIILHPGIPDGTDVSIYQSFNEYSNSSNITATAKAEKGKIVIGLKIIKPGVVKLESTEFKYKVFVEPGDELTLNSGKSEVSFSGSNAAGQYYVNKMKPNGKSADQDFDSSILLAATPAAMWDSTLSRMEKYKTVYHQLQKDGKMTPALHAYLVDYVDMFVLMYAYMRFNSNDAGSKLHTTLSQDELLAYIKKLYTVYDPLAPKYWSMPIWSIVLGNKYRLINKEHPVDENAEVFAKWKSFEKGKRIYGLAPDNIQEIEMAKTVLFLIGHGEATKSELSDQIDHFKHYYPKSQWNGFIDQQFELVPNVVSKQKSAGKSKYYMKYDAAHDGLQMIMGKNLQQISGIQELVKEVSPGTPVLVDCWATWCSPCIAELRHSKELHHFLDSAHVNVLYLSFDAPNNRNILTTIEKYQLNGLHYVASDTIADSVSKLYGSQVLQIPRFILFDGHGNLLEANMPPPSSGNKLYGQIREKLKN